MFRDMGESSKMEDEDMHNGRAGRFFGMDDKNSPRGGERVFRSITVGLLAQ